MTNMSEESNKNVKEIKSMQTKVLMYEYSTQRIRRLELNHKSLTSVQEAVSNLENECSELPHSSSSFSYNAIFEQRRGRNEKTCDRVSTLPPVDDYGVYSIVVDPKR